MKNIKKVLPEDADQSAIINKDTEFENRSVDPGFCFEETNEGLADDQDKDLQEKVRPTNVKPNEQETERGMPGLAELDGTNPGSNHHPMDDPP